MLETVETTGNDSPEEMARMATERNGLYRLLATIFREELTADLLHQLLDADFLKKLAAVGVDVDAISELSPDEESLEELSLEFCRLFMGPGKHVSPYESVHIGGDGGSLWGPQTSAVKHFIERSGFAYDEDYHGLPDHISVELEFMAHLTSLEAKSWQRCETDKAMNCLKYEKEFLDRHLGRWVSSFSEKVAELAEVPVYPQMATLTRDFVAADHLELGKIKGLDTWLH